MTFEYFPLRNHHPHSFLIVCVRHYLFLMEERNTMVNFKLVFPQIVSLFHTFLTRSFFSSLLTTGFLDSSIIYYLLSEPQTTKRTE